MSYIHIIYANLCKLFSFVLIAQHFQQEKWIDHDHFSPEANFHICNCSKSKDIRNQLIFPLQIWCHDISPISFFVSLKGVSPNCKLLQVQKCLYLHTYSSNLKHSEYSVISRGRSIWQNQLLDYRNSLKFSCGIATVNVIKLLGWVIFVWHCGMISSCFQLKICQCFILQCGMFMNKCV